MRLKAKLSPVMSSVFEAIRFDKKYQSLSDSHSHDLDEMMDDYDNSKVEEMLNSMGYKAKYLKNENFFKIVDKNKEVKFQFNISLNYGAGELIWAMWIDGEHSEAWTLE